MDSMDTLCVILEKMIEDSHGQNTSKGPSQSVQDFYNKLKSVYLEPNFRHSYAVLSSFLEKHTPDTYPVLKQWLLWVIDYCQNLKSDKEQRIVYQQLQKLLDHIELECMRLDRIQSVNCLRDEILITQEKIQKDKKDIQQSLDEIKELNKETRKTSDDVNQRINDYHGQSIAILGIFSAVVLVFMSGVGFSSSVLDNINKASLFRLGFTILLLGIVLSNVIYILLKYVWLLSKRNSGETKTPKTGQLWFNLVLSLLLAALLAAYGFGLDKVIARYRQDNFSFDTIPDSSAVSVSLPDD